MTEPEFEIPFERLPERFLETISHGTGVPVRARPAATVVLLRESAGGIEVLLLRRSRDAQFVPGAYVFPGGRVDAGDRSPALAERVHGLTPLQAASRLGLDEPAEAMAYYLAALREAFEETGILVGHLRGGAPPPTAADDERVEALRQDLLEDRAEFGAVLEALDCRLDGTALEYVAHWVTPETEPRRYDTRFFVARVADGARSAPHRGEVTDALWLTPAEALERHARGDLPMVFPTIKSLEQLAAFTDVETMLAELGRREVPTFRPRLVVTRTGVAITLSAPPDARSEP